MSGHFPLLFYFSLFLMLTMGYQKWMSKGQGYLNNARGKEGEQRIGLLKRSMKCYRRALSKSPPDTKNFIRTRIRSIKGQIDYLKYKKKKTHSSNNEENDMDQFIVKDKTNVSFKDIGGLQHAKQYLRDRLIAPLDHPSLAKKFGKRPVNGLLAYGPPGTGKTMLAKAAATESKEASLIQITPSDILNKFLGESEDKVRKIFELAIDKAPSIIIFDELESIATDRNLASANKRSIVNQLLTEISELNSHGKDQLPVLLIGTTNNPILLDSALLRSGRLSDRLYIGPPGREGRREIIQQGLEQKKEVLKGNIDIDTLLDLTAGYTGAEVVGDMDRVFNRGFRNSVENDGNVRKVGMDDFLEVFKRDRTLAVDIWRSEMKANLDNNPKDYPWLREVI